jgi:hypothetical protein
MQNIQEQVNDDIKLYCKGICREAKKKKAEVKRKIEGLILL